MSEPQLKSSTALDERLGLPSCSELHRHIACPGYNQLKAACPTKQSSCEAATFGQEVHAALNEVDGVPITEFQGNIIRKCELAREKIVADIFGDSQYSIIRETRLWCYGDEQRPKILSGQPDWVGLCPEKASVIIIDYKSLPGEVSPVEENWQILGLMVCLCEELIAGRFDYMTKGAPIEWFYGSIIQPLVDGKQTTVVKYGLDKILECKSMIYERLTQNQVAGAPRIPGAHCKGCPVAGSCVEGSAMGMVLAKRTPKDLVGRLSPEEICELLPRLPAIHSICDAILQRAKEIEGEKPGTLGAYKLIERKGDRTLTDLKGARDAVAGVVAKEEFSAMLTMALGALRDLYSSKRAEAGGTTKKAAGEEFDKLIEPFIERGSPKSTLVPVK